MKTFPYFEDLPYSYVPQPPQFLHERSHNEICQWR